MRAEEGGEQKKEQGPGQYPILVTEDVFHPDTSPLNDDAT